MRTGLGLLVLIIGMIVLGLWARNDHAGSIQSQVLADAKQALGQTVHQTSVAVSGRDIHVAGLADSEDERSEILQRLDAVTGRRVVTDQLDVLEPAQPYRFRVEKTEDALAFSGNKPTQKAFEAELGAKAASLELASGMPDQNWPDMIKRSVEATALLETSQIDLQDRSLTLKGLAKDASTSDQVTSLFADLPAGYAAELAIEVVEPVVVEAEVSEAGLSLDYDIATGVTVSGTAPAGVDRNALQQALNVPAIDGNIETSDGPGGEALLSQVAKLSAWLPSMETLAGSFTATASKFDVTLRPGFDQELVRSELSKDMGDSATLSVAPLDAAPETGAQRVNSLTGLAEVYGGGYWLPVLEFEVNRDGCERQTNGTIESAKINFLSGTADLDPKSLQTINTLAAILRKCLQSGSLKLEIGGHTDSQGSDSANMSLSDSRAQAVRNAFEGRGVPSSNMTTKAYGETSPIAENNTAEGRAKNRRTSFTWSEG